LLTAPAVPFWFGSCFAENDEEADWGPRSSEKDAHVEDATLPVFMEVCLPSQGTEDDSLPSPSYELSVLSISPLLRFMLCFVFIHWGQCMF